MLKFVFRMAGRQRVSGRKRAYTALVNTEGQATFDQLYVRINRTWLGRTVGIRRISLYGHSQQFDLMELEWMGHLQRYS